MCHGEAQLGACNRDEGYIEYLNGNVVECSGGACVRPDVCTQCNEGYYSASDGYCRGLFIEMIAIHCNGTNMRDTPNIYYRFFLRSDFI